MSLELSGTEWLLLDPWFLALIPLAWLLFAWRMRRPRAALPAASVAVLAGLPRTLRARLVWLPPAALGGAVSLLAVALARPVTRDVVPLRSQGVDILLVLDTSSSMDTPDAEPGTRQRRVEAARQRAIEFAEAREGDRLGLVTFARFADLRCPPTLDERALAAFLRSVDTVRRGSDEDATAIGVAVGQATRILAENDAGSKIVVLLTDGEETAGEVDPLAAAKLAADEGVRVHTIGLGQGMVDPFFGRVIEPDFSLIEKIAETTGGRFFRARTGADLGEVYAEIDRLEKRELEDPRYRTTDWFARPMAAGAALLLLALLVELVWIRGLP